MFIDGFGIQEYKSFGRNLQRIGPLKKINIFIGQNNSGKSNILLFLKHHYATTLRCGNLKFEPVDQHSGDRSGKQIREFGLKIGGRNYNNLSERLKDQLKDNDNLVKIIESIFGSEILTRKENNIAWFRYEGPGREALSPDIINKFSSEGSIGSSAWQALWSHLTGRGGGGLTQHWIPETLRALSPVNLAPPKVDLIPAIRKVEKGGQVENDYSGIGIIDRLAELQQPRYDEEHKRERFDEINRFLQTVTGKLEARLGIPHDREMINVYMDGKMLPLSSVGTGIHEVIILAAASTVLQDQVLCIEEPELHLHPHLQKELVRYLYEKTSNQYFISTHSAHMLDTPDAAIFHVQLQDGQSVVELVSTDSEKSRICDDLGYRASDLLQANCVIWVEGPSDRIYLNHWINRVDAELVEGLHYSIMFYGGRLLSHLTADDPEVEDFISLRRLNRHIAIVIDSDRPEANKWPNKTKRRIKKEFNKGPGFAWITKGREIENYIEADILEEAVKKVHPTVVRLSYKGNYDNCLRSVKTKGGRKNFKVDKVKVANEVTKSSTNLDMLDLRKMVEKLVRFIHASNNFEST